MNLKIQVKINQEIRIDSYLKEELSISRSKIQKLIKQGLVTVNGKVISSNYLVKPNDLIIINDDLDYNISIEPENIPIDIIYEDNDLLVINKKSGMVVHPAPGHYTGTLVNALLYRFHLSTGEVNRPGIVHRLDKDTSGLMLVAKNDQTHEALSRMIANKEVERHYLAIVDGVIKHDNGTIDAPIGRSTHDRKKMAVRADGKEAITHFRVLKRYDNATLIELKLETGRTHQIRVHMDYIGHPLVNDPVYGNRKLFDDSGQCLHAKELGFVHPRTLKYMQFDSELPECFLNILKKFE